MFVPVPLPVLLVDVQPPDAPPRLEAVLVAACTRSLRSTECVVVGDGTKRRRIWAEAVVRWSEPRERSATIELRQLKDGRVERRSTTLAFKARDQRTERWAAVGYSVAALATEPEADAEAVAQQSPMDAAHRCGRGLPCVPHGAPAPAGDPADRDPGRGPIWRFSFGPAAGPGLDDGEWRFGACARVSLVVTAVPVFATASGSWLSRASSVPVLAEWLETSIGLGTSWHLGEPRFDVSAGLLGEHFSVSATHPQTGTTSRGSRWLSGFELLLSGSWPSRGWVGGIAGVDVWRLHERTGISVGGQPVAGTLGVGWTLVAGVELRVPPDPVE